MKLSRIYEYINSLAVSFWKDLKPAAKLIIAAISAIIGVVSIGAAASTGYHWSFRSNFQIYDVFELSPNKHTFLFQGVFIPGIVATVGHGILKLLFRQITRHRTGLTRWYTPVRIFVHNNGFLVWMTMWLFAAAIIFMPSWKLSIEFIAYSFLVILILYISVYSVEFRFSIREVITIKFYMFYRRTGVSSFRINSVRITWVGACILSISFLFGFYEYKAALTRCVSIETNNNNIIEDRSIVFSGSTGILVGRCVISQSASVQSLNNSQYIFIPSSDVSKIIIK